MMTWLAEKWDRFFFDPTSPSPVCVFRILYGLLCIINGVLWLPVFTMWFGHDSVRSVDAVLRQTSDPRLSLLLWFNPSDHVVLLLLAVYILASFCVMVGFRTRLSTIVVFVLAASIYHRNPEYWHSADGVLRDIGFTIMFAPAGMMYSLDAWLKRSSGKDRPVLVSPWAQRLLQFQLCFIYWKAFWGKIAGATWQNGTAVYYASHLVLWNNLPVSPMFEHAWSVKAFTWGTIAIEFSLWSLIWIRPFRYWVLLAGVIFHLMINFDFNIDLLEIAAIGCYVNFIYPADLERVINWCTSRLPIGKRETAALSPESVQ